ncbi:MAG TPA: hypothetical protein VM370_07115 [Candidatus Thermoplasmatota archaeon]|nr:hypothetical protein [Candidatus Thermoplasmatota archaeon]
MATVKSANVPPTHPSVWAGLALAAVGLLVAIFAYTGTRVYDIAFAFAAMAGALLALAGILVAAWGRSIMASRASRSRRTLMTQDALALAKPVAVRGSEELPTVAEPSEKKRFSFSMPKRARKEERPADTAALFAFKRKAAPEPARAADDPRHPDVAARLAEEPSIAAQAPKPVRATLKCPQCGNTFTAEGVRPFTASCQQCGFASTV